MNANEKPQTITRAIKTQSCWQPGEPAEGRRTKRGGRRQEKWLLEHIHNRTIQTIFQRSAFPCVNRIWAILSLDFGNAWKMHRPAVHTKEPPQSTHQQIEPRDSVDVIGSRCTMQSIFQSLCEWSQMFWRVRFACLQIISNKEISSLSGSFGAFLSFSRNLICYKTITPTYRVNNGELH